MRLHRVVSSVLSGVLSAVLSAVLSISAASAAQPMATTVSGRVLDGGGGVLPGVTITVTPIDGSGPPQTVVTGPDGSFSVRVPIGVVRIRAEMAGFQIIEREVRALPNATQRIDLVFRIGGFTVPSSTPPPRPPDSVPIRWNAWMERPGRAYSPEPYLRPGQDYSFVVHLAGIAYTARRGLASRSVSNTLGQHLETWLKEHPNDTQARLTVLLVPDARALRTIGPAATDLVVSLSKLRAFKEAPPDVPADVMTHLSAEHNPAYVFGDLKLHVAVQDDFTGTANVALSIWHGMRPVDELVLSFCVARENPAQRCSRHTPVAESLYGIDAVRIAADQSFSEPDLALHFIDFPDRHVIGTLRDKQWPATTFVTWSLGIPAGEFKKRLEGMPRDLANTTAEEEHRTTGVALYGLLFPLPAAREARIAFEAALRPFVKPIPFSSAPASLFIRSIMRDISDSPYVPAAFIYPGALEALVGYHAFIEMPLPLQTYEPPETCINRWVFLLPIQARDNELRTARGVVNDRYDVWRAAGAQLFGEMRSFTEWAGRDEDDDVPTVLAVLSHQEEDRFRFDAGQFVYAEHFNRRFGHSIAILSACETAHPGPSALVRRLNARGIVALVGTTSKVPPVLGGAMLRELASVTEAKDRPSVVPLATLFRRAQKRLWSAAAHNGHAPSEVLKFTLLGNAGVTVCTPLAGSQ